MMIEKIVLDYLGEEIPSYMEIPAELPAVPFLVIEKIGSGRANRIDNATIAVQSYGGTLEEAAETNSTVKRLMLDGLVTLPEIGRVSLNSDYNFTDTATKRYRYQAVFDITYYEEGY